ncbi:hypothetical protein BH23GEM6_BH23GEM6_25850 [soil metagenome]
MFALVLLDLTFREVISDLPHDAGAMIAYLLLFLFVGFIVIGSRRSSGEPGQPTSEP